MCDGAATGSGFHDRVGNDGLPCLPSDGRWGGDLQAGETLYEECRICPGDRGQGEPRRHGPALVTQSPAQLVKLLMKYRAGLHRTARLSLEARQMRSIARQLPDEQAILDVAAYIGTLLPEPGRADRSAAATNPTGLKPASLTRDTMRMRRSAQFRSAGAGISSPASPER